jgi:hypothetical protein
MTNQKYNGWTNRETWVVNLWMDEELQEMINEWLSHNQKMSVLELAEELERHFDEYFDEELNNMSGVLKDLLYIESIDWYDLASTYRNEWFATNLNI